MSFGFLEGQRNFTFERRPKPVPGEMRIAWRTGISLMILANSRGKRASFAKLHLLNDAVRSESSRQKLRQMLDGQLSYLTWRIRVEPAFSRALDYLVGERFATWMVSGQRTSLQLTGRGADAAGYVAGAEDALLAEREFLESIGQKVTEAFVKQVIAAGTHLL